MTNSNTVVVNDGAGASDNTKVQYTTEQLEAMNANLSVFNLKVDANGRYSVIDSRAGLNEQMLHQFDNIPNLNDRNNAIQNQFRSIGEKYDKLDAFIVKMESPYKEVYEEEFMLMKMADPGYLNYLSLKGGNALNSFVDQFMDTVVNNEYFYNIDTTAEVRNNPDNPYKGIWQDYYNLRNFDDKTIEKWTQAAEAIGKMRDNKYEQVKAAEKETSEKVEEKSETSQKTADNSEKTSDNSEKTGPFAQLVAGATAVFASAKNFLEQHGVFGYVKNAVEKVAVFAKDAFAKARDKVTEFVNNRQNSTHEEREKQVENELGDAASDTEPSGKEAGESVPTTGEGGTLILF